MHPSLTNHHAGRAARAVRWTLGRPPLVWLLLVAWFSATAWIRPLAMPDEGRYLSVAWEMFVRDAWAVPTLDGMPFFHKPPLFYWLADAAMRVFGVNAFAGRLPSIIAAATFACALHRFAWSWRGARFAATLLLVLTTSPYFYFGAQYANMDLLVSALIGFTVLFTAHAVLKAEDGLPMGIALPAAYATAGLGVLAKGLIGCVLPAAIVLCWLLVTRRAQLALRLLSVPGLIVFACITLPWVVAMQARYPGFLDYFIVEQHFHRFAGAGFNNAQPFWFYVPVLLVLMFPWSLAAPAAWTHLRSQSAPDDTPSPQHTLNMLMVCWAAVVLVFFSIPRSKLIGYALPAVPPLAWLFADALRALGANAAMRKHQWTFAAASCAIMAAAIAAYSIRAPNSSQQIAAALQEKRRPDEPVVFVGTYPYDLVFQTHLRPPILVVQQWSDASIDKSDSWQKELLDAARFRPDAASRALVEELPASDGHRTWIVLPSAMRPAPQLHAALVADNTQLSLWMAGSR